MDIRIEHDGNGWAASRDEYGDFVLTEEDSADEIRQRIAFNLLVWLGECVYQRSVGVPYLESVFGSEPSPGALAILLNALRSTEGVSAIVGDPEFDLGADRVLQINATVLTTNADTLEVGLEVQ